MKQTDTTLVIGGKGKTGRRVIERLQQRGLTYRVGSRSAQPAVDWEDEKTWSPALKGIGNPSLITVRDHLPTRSPTFRVLTSRDGDDLAHRLLTEN